MWSIGVLAYVMLSGFLPYTGETKQETFLNITSAVLDFPDDLFKGISESAIDFICKLLKKKPKQRLSSLKSLEHEWLQNVKINDQSEQMQQATNEELEKLNACNTDKDNQSLNQESSVNNNLCKINVDTNKQQSNLEPIQNGQILNENKNGINCTTANNPEFMQGNKSLNENSTDKTELNNELENNENQLNKTGSKDDKLSLDNVGNLKNNSNQEIINTSELINICSNAPLLTAN